MQSLYDCKCLCLELQSITDAEAAHSNEFNMAVTDGYSRSVAEQQPLLIRRLGAGIAWQ
jgi:hypothetical protein